MHPLATCPGCAGTARDAVYLWTPGDGDYVFDTFGSEFDTVLYVMEGACGEIEVACNDDVQQLLSAVTLNDVTAGTTYTIGVAGFRGRNGRFSSSMSSPCLQTNLVLEVSRILVMFSAAGGTQRHIASAGAVMQCHRNTSPHAGPERCVHGVGCSVIFQPWQGTGQFGELRCFRTSLGAAPAPASGISAGLLFQSSQDDLR